MRLGVIWAGVEPQPGRYDDAYLARIKGTVDVLAAQGIASLLDFHQDMVNPRFQGNGWPDWAVLDKGAPNVVKAGFPGNYFLNQGVKNSYDSFYADAPAADGVGIATHYAAAWAHTARYLRGTPGVMGFDLYNEPFPGSDFAPCLLPAGCRTQDARLARVQQLAVDAIRAVDPATTIYYEPQQFFNIGVPTHVRLSGANLALSFHDYCLTQSVLRRYAGCSGPDTRVFANARAHAAATGSGLLLTEFGATTRSDVLDAQTDLAMRNRVGYQFWAYTGGDPTTAGPGNEQALVFDPTKAPTGDNVDWAKLRSVAVPHPDRVAGVPADYAYDRAAGRFTLRYDTGRADGSGAFPAGATTTVAIPQVAAPAGYAVHVTGGHVTSAADAPTLSIAADAGASRVEVTVTRR